MEKQFGKSYLKIESIDVDIGKLYWQQNGIIMKGKNILKRDLNQVCVWIKRY